MELYDFDNNKIYQKSAYDLFGTKKTSIRGVAINYQSNNDYLLLYGYLSDDGSNFHLKKLKFTSLEITNANTNPKITSKPVITSTYGKSLSCFMTDLRNIVCLYLYNYSSNTINYYYFLYLQVFDENFNQITLFKVDSSYINEYSFYKCLYLAEEAGLFAFFNKLDNNPYDTNQHLKIYIRQFIGNVVIIILILVKYIWRK